MTNARIVQITPNGHEKVNMLFIDENGQTYPGATDRAYLLESARKNHIDYWPGIHAEINVVDGIVIDWRIKQAMVVDRLIDRFADLIVISREVLQMEDTQDFKKIPALKKTLSEMMELVECMEVSV